MEKKKYMKPSMQVHNLPSHRMILCYSNGELGRVPSIPGISHDENNLA